MTYNGGRDSFLQSNFKKYLIVVNDRPEGANQTTTV